MRCYICKKDFQKDELIRAGKIGSNNCRPCNTARFKRYRKSKTYLKSLSAASRRAYEKHREKWLARAKVGYAVKTGKLIKPKSCEVCDKKLPLQGHHEDYSKPLEVIWLCSGCHADADKALEAKQSNL